MQCFGSGSALKLTPWIRIRIKDADSGSALEMRIPDPDPGAIKSLKNREILNIFYKISLTYFKGINLNFVSVLWY